VTLNSSAWRGWRFRVQRFDVEDEFDESTCDENRGKMRGKVVVKKELTAHDVEGNIMSGPGKEKETSGVVKTGASAYEELEVSRMCWSDILTLIEGVHTAA
jgi:hypothetical protein